ncbi:TIGR03435 family protein [Silvibacterium dinghuense]|nr:TIGR03435 family protein [Silvibacterium dinghuense]GGG98315.1 hypothetical protein GCM10011586_12130 [Silvibacterium dinghuense]
MGAFILFPGALLIAQSGSGDTTSADQAGPAFEVATIRQANRGDGRHWFGTKLDNSDRFQTSAMSLTGLVYEAYMIPPAQNKVEIDHGVPDWVNSVEYDITAKIENSYMKDWDRLSYEQRMNVIRPMLQALLAERFHLRLRTEDRMTPVYVLVQAKGGAHVKEVSAPEPVKGDEEEAQKRWADEHPNGVYPGVIMCTGEKCIAHAVKISTSIGQISANAHSDRMVIDETGLKGYYDFSIPYPDKADEFPMHTVEEALGMKFESRSVPIQTYVIVSAEKPAMDGVDNPPPTR